MVITTPEPDSRELGGLGLEPEPELLDTPHGLDDVDDVADDPIQKRITAIDTNPDRSRSRLESPWASVTAQVPSPAPDLFDFGPEHSGWESGPRRGGYGRGGGGDWGIIWNTLQRTTAHFSCP